MGGRGLGGMSTAYLRRVVRHRPQEGHDSRAHPNVAGGVRQIVVNVGTCEADSVKLGVQHRRVSLLGVVLELIQGFVLILIEFSLPARRGKPTT